MIFLRCVSFMIGIAIIMGAPFFLLPELPTRAFNVSSAVLGCLAIGISSSGFLLVGVAGDHFRRSMRARVTAGVLLSVPMAASLAVLSLDELPDVVWYVVPLFCSAAALFMLFVFPGRPARSRRLRPREVNSALTH